jgi:protein involved in polysaccharide export with SLBB domain
MRQSSASLFSILHKAAFVAGLGVAILPSLAQTSTPSTQEAPSASQGGVGQPSAENGPIRLRRPPQKTDEDGTETFDSTERAEPMEPKAPPAPSEFERFLKQTTGQTIRRLGIEVVTAMGATKPAEWGTSVPPDYVVEAGDEVLVTLWGSVEADLRLLVDRSGRISVPRVGAIQVGGVRYDQLPQVIERRVALTFKNFQASVAMGKLRGIRVFVTGYVMRPGTYSVSALSTALGAVLQAGGPSAAGSFRKLELKRQAETVARIDLYDLLVRGDNSGDRLLRAGDVIHVGPVGKQVAVWGSVNRPAVIELVDGEGLQQALVLAGGFSALAERNRLTVDRLSDRARQRVEQIDLPSGAATTLENGDVLRAFNATQTATSTTLQNKRVRVDGEVRRPGEYILPANSTLDDALRAAGGLTSSAFVYGSQFSRVSVRATQQENYERALRDLETDFARASASQRVSSSDQASQTQNQGAATARLVERLRALKPGGRVVLQVAPQSNELPQLALEDGDHLYVPPKPTTVGVFGSVFNTGSYLFADGRAIGDYTRLAGGPTKGADEGSMFVIRANGQVVSGRQNSQTFWFSRGGGFSELKAEAGDTIFVPEEMDKTTFLQAAKDWTQILYQLGIGIAGITNALR